MGGNAAWDAAACSMAESLDRLQLVGPAEPQERLHDARVEPLDSCEGWGSASEQGASSGTGLHETFIVDAHVAEATHDEVRQ